MPIKKKATTRKASAKKSVKPRRAAAPRARRAAKSGPLAADNQAVESRIEESKYYPGPVMQKFEGPREFELPGGYDINRIVLMVRDPYWIYAYWEINQKKLSEIRSELGDKFGQSRLILRVYDTQNWNFFDLQVHGLAGNWYINVGRPNTSYCVDIGFITSDGVFVVAARSNVVTTPRDRMSEVIDEEWMIPDWDTMYALSGGFRMRQGSFELREMMEKNLLNPASSPGVSSLFSPVRPQQPRPFWLVANCELIVYGATEPTASLTIQGKPIKLREDGTFTVRYALPDGRQHIPIEAVRDDGAEKRRIIPIVERRTE
ncbi:MAG TPA: DUF4912 domain-containing protein [Candidatus Omnitrophota bacterium]|nr:DUF4912 domain-containing protein [Candidatus Omnitrophota bacterium]